jgi:hypothetical protein
VTVVLLNTTAGDQQVIKVYKTEGKVEENVVHQPLEGHASIFQAKRHVNKLKKSKRLYHCCLVNTPSASPASRKSYSYPCKHKGHPYWAEEVTTGPPVAALFLHHVQGAIPAAGRPMNKAGIQHLLELKFGHAHHVLMAELHHCGASGRLDCVLHPMRQIGGHREGL